MAEALGVASQCSPTRHSQPSRHCVSEVFDLQKTLALFCGVVIDLK